MCPTSSTTWFPRDLVTDTGTSGEFGSPAETVQVSLPANVIACPDGGISDAGPTDCETILAFLPSGAVAGPAGSGDAGAQSCSLSAPGVIAGITASVPLQMGQEYELVENATGSLLLGTAPVWNYYASSSDCHPGPGGQSLGSMTFDPNTPIQSLCFRADADYTDLNWFSSSVGRAGVGNGTWQLCHGCGCTRDAGP